MVNKDYHLFYFIYLVIMSFTFDATISGEIKTVFIGLLHGAWASGVLA